MNYSFNTLVDLDIDKDGIYYYENLEVDINNDWKIIKIIGMELLVLLVNTHSNHFRFSKLKTNWLRSQSQSTSH